jgi:hypothetical protein
MYGFSKMYGFSEFLFVNCANSTVPNLVIMVTLKAFDVERYTGL